MKINITKKYIKIKGSWGLPSLYISISINFKNILIAHSMQEKKRETSNNMGETINIIIIYQKKLSYDFEKKGYSESLKKV